MEETRQTEKIIEHFRDKTFFDGLMEVISEMQEGHTSKIGASMRALDFFTKASLLIEANKAEQIFREIKFRLTRLREEATKN